MSAEVSCVLNNQQKYYFILSSVITDLYLSSNSIQLDERIFNLMLKNSILIMTDVVQITLNEQIDSVFDSLDMNQDVSVPYMTGIIADIHN